MAFTEQMSQGITILGQLASVSLAAGTDNSITGIDMKNVKRIMFVLNVGSVGASGTVDFKLQQAKTSGGTYKDIAGTAITQVTTSGKVVTVEVRSDQLDLANGYEFVRHNLVIGTNAVLIGVIALGGEAAQKPAAANFDIAAVAQRLAA